MQKGTVEKPTVIKIKHQKKIKQPKKRVRNKEQKINTQMRQIKNK